MPAPCQRRASQVPSLKSGLWQELRGTHRALATGAGWSPAWWYPWGMSPCPCLPLLGVAAGTGRCPPQAPHRDPGCKLLGKAGAVARSLRKGLGRGALVPTTAPAADQQLSPQLHPNTHLIRCPSRHPPSPPAFPCSTPWCWVLPRGLGHGRASSHHGSSPRQGPPPAESRTRRRHQALRCLILRGVISSRPSPARGDAARLVLSHRPGDGSSDKVGFVGRAGHPGSLVRLLWESDKGKTL